MKPALTLFKGGLLLRPLEEKDLITTLQWRNQDDVRMNFFHKDIISYEQHHKWFENYLIKKDDIVFVGEFDGEIIGQLAIYDIDTLTKKAEVGRFIISPEYAGKGYMKKLINLLFELCGNLKIETLYLYVIPTNYKAISLYEKLGFVVKENTTESILMER